MDSVTDTMKYCYYTESDKIDQDTQKCDQMPVDVPVTVIVPTSSSTTIPLLCSTKSDQMTDDSSLVSDCSEVEDANTVIVSTDPSIPLATYTKSEQRTDNSLLVSDSYAKECTNTVLVSLEDSQDDRPEVAYSHVDHHGSIIKADDYLLSASDIEKYFPFAQMNLEFPDRNNGNFDPNMQQNVAKRQYPFNLSGNNESDHPCSEKRSSKSRGRRSYDSQLSWRKPFTCNNRRHTLPRNLNVTKHFACQQSMDRFSNVPPYVDSHCHIDFILSDSEFKSWSSLKEQYKSLKPRNFKGAMQVFCDPRRFNVDDHIVKMLECEDDLWFSFGCHPKKVVYFTDDAFSKLKKCLQLPLARALGEIGLDYSFKFFMQASEQQAALRRQLPLALEYNLPVVLHCREGYSTCGILDADNDLMNILKEILPLDHRIHLHCFTRDWPRAERWLRTFPNLSIGLTPLITYANASESILEVARRLPLDRFLLETDSPYFIPHEVDKKEMPHSLPWFSVFVAEKMAAIRDVPLDLILRMTYSNFRKLYGIY